MERNRNCVIGHSHFFQYIKRISVTITNIKKRKVCLGIRVSKYEPYFFPPFYFCQKLVVLTELSIHWYGKSGKDASELDSVFSGPSFDRILNTKD